MGREPNKGGSLVPSNFNPNRHHLELFDTVAGLLSKTRKGHTAKTVIP